jgi:hypothetical protein
VKHEVCLNRNYCYPSKENLRQLSCCISNPLFAAFDPTELLTFFGRKISGVYYIENPYCHFATAKERQASLPVKKLAESLQKSFEETSSILDDMWSYIKTFDRVYTNEFVALFNKKEEIFLPCSRLTMNKRE